MFRILLFEDAKLKVDTFLHSVESVLALLKEIVPDEWFDTNPTHTSKWQFIFFVSSISSDLMMVELSKSIPLDFVDGFKRFKIQKDSFKNNAVHMLKTQIQQSFWFLCIFLWCPNF